jgi:hypothetical protein
MIHPARHAVSMQHIRGTPRETRRSYDRIHAFLATCKTRDFREKVDEFGILAGDASQKEKKWSDDALILSRFFRGTMFASFPLALTISSPETNSACPQAKAGLLAPSAPHRGSPLVARPFFFQRTGTCAHCERIFARIFVSQFLLG